MSEKKSHMLNNFDDIPAFISESGSDDENLPDLLWLFGDDEKDYNEIKKAISECLPFSDFLTALNIKPDDFKSFGELRLKIFRMLNRCVGSGCMAMDRHCVGFDWNGKPAVSCINHMLDIDAGGQLALYEDVGCWIPIKAYKSRGGG